MESQTKITKATIRIMNSYNWGNFEVSLSVENDNGLISEEIDSVAIQAQGHVNEALENYKVINQPQTPIKQISKKDNTSIADIESLPLYADIKKRAQEQKAKKDARN